MAAASADTVPQQEPTVIREGYEEEQLALLDAQEEQDTYRLIEEVEKNGPQVPTYEPLEAQPEQTPFVPQPFVEEPTSAAAIQPPVYQRTAVIAPQFYNTTLKPPSYSTIIEQAEADNPLETALLFSNYVFNNDETYKPSEMDVVTQKAGAMRSMIQYAMQSSERGKRIHKVAAWNTINVPMRFDDLSEQYHVYNSYTDRLVRMRLQFQRGYILFSAGLAGMLRHSPFMMSINGTMNVFNYKAAEVPRLSNGSLYHLFAPHLIHLMAGGDVPTEPNRRDTFLPSHFVPVSLVDSSSWSHRSYIVSPLFVWDNGRFYKTCKYDEPNPIQTRVPTTAIQPQPPRRRHVNWHAAPKSTTSVACTHNYGAALDMNVTKIQIGMHHLQSALQLALLELDDIHTNEAAVRDMMHWWCKQQEALLLVPLLAAYDGKDEFAIVRRIIDGMDARYQTTIDMNLRMYAMFLRSIVTEDAHIDEFPGPLMIATQSDFKRFFGLCVFLCKGDPNGTYVHSSLRESFVDDTHSNGRIVPTLHVLTFEQTTQRCVDPYYMQAFATQDTKHMTQEQRLQFDAKRYDHERLRINRDRLYKTIHKEIADDLASMKQTNETERMIQRFTDEEFKAELLRIFVKYGESLNPERSRLENERHLAEQEQRRLQRQQEQLEQQRHAHEEHYQQAVAMWTIRQDQERARREEETRHIEAERQQLLDNAWRRNHTIYEERRQQLRASIERRTTAEGQREAAAEARYALERAGAPLKRVKTARREQPSERVVLEETPPTPVAASPEAMAAGAAAGIPEIRPPRIRLRLPKQPSPGAASTSPEGMAGTHAGKRTAPPQAPSPKRPAPGAASIGPESVVGTHAVKRTAAPPAQQREAKRPTPGAASTSPEGMVGTHAEKRTAAPPVQQREAKQQKHLPSSPAALVHTVAEHLSKKRSTSGAVQQPAPPAPAAPPILLYLPGEGLESMQLGPAAAPPVFGAAAPAVAVPAAAAAPAPLPTTQTAPPTKRHRGTPMVLPAAGGAAPPPLVAGGAAQAPPDAAQAQADQPPQPQQQAPPSAKKRSAS